MAPRVRLWPFLAGPRGRAGHLVSPCVFRTKLDTDSGANWTVIPDQTGQRFRRKLDTDSGGKLDSFQPLTGIVRT